MPDHDDVRNKLMQTIRTINETCVAGKGFGKIAPLFREDCTMVHPRFTAGPRAGTCASRTTRTRVRR